jgi:hypothetical protein
LFINPVFLVPLFSALGEEKETEAESEAVSEAEREPATPIDYVRLATDMMLRNANAENYSNIAHEQELKKSLERAPIEVLCLELGSTSKP